jgi:Peptidase A4 family/PASTA domain
MFNLTLWRPAMIAAATVTALAAGGGAAYAAAIPSTTPAATGPGAGIYATGMHASAVESIRSSSPAGALTLKTTDAYAADQTSTNWSGYVTPANTGAYNATSTTFTVPSSIRCTSTDTASSFWAGLDGATANDDTVEQDGVEADCTDGSLAMYAWLETFPAAEEEIVSSNDTPAPVHPGDVVVSTVTEDSPSEYNFVMDDETQGWNINSNLTMPAGSTGEDQTSEVITEATTECTSASASSCTIMPITNFGKVAYTSASYNGGTAYTSSNTTPIELEQNGALADTVGALGAGGAFTVTHGKVVPNEIGRTDLATAEAGIRAAGLVAKAAGASAVGNLGEVTAESPAAGTTVAIGTTVTLTYTLPKVTVPSEIGRTDLATAEAGIRAAGLVPKAVGASGAGNKGKVTAESPAAGAKVAKGSTVTLTYTVK